MKAAMFTAWSYSRWALYESCPLRAKYKHLDKLPDPSSAAMQRGTDIHKIAEEFVGKAYVSTPLVLMNFEAEFRGLQRLYNCEGRVPMSLEQEWAFNSNWEPTGWFSQDAWCRIKVDLTFTLDDFAVIIDYKTGKPRGSDQEQLSLYNTGALSRNVNEVGNRVHTVSSHLWYLDLGVAEERVVACTGDNLVAHQKAWEKKVKPMMNDTRFVPRPGDGCRWCPYSKSKKGPCKY